ncbi:MAG: MBL fold metallo-hydrolase [bacterium]
MRRSPNFVNGRFVNLFPVRRIQFWPMLRAFLRDSRYREPRRPIPVVRRSRAFFLKLPRGGLRITWLGHSTVLVELDGQRVITDPMWSRYISPVRGLGPRRFFEPPVALRDLPPIDVVVISHDHLDHLDMVTIQSLARAQPRIRFVVPLGVGAHLEAWSVSRDRIVELDWWESATVGRLRLVATPARHVSGRTFGSLKRTLWSGWAILGPTHRVYFSGDTGMSPSFHELGHRLGPFDVTLMDTGAYDPLWADAHLGPEQAVQAHRAVRGRLVMPVHWGTFMMSTHGWTEPAERLWAAARKAGVKVAIPRPGEPVEPAAPRRQTRWWPSNPWVRAAGAPVKSSCPAGCGLWRTLTRRRWNGTSPK